MSLPESSVQVIQRDLRCKSSWLFRLRLVSSDRSSLIILFALLAVLTSEVHLLRRRERGRLVREIVVDGDALSSLLPQADID